MMQGFTPLAASIGGLAIGSAAAVLWLGNGRIAGISGILGGLLRAPRGDRAWRIAFLSGLILAPLLYNVLVPVAPRASTAGLPVLIVAGLLVGYGTRLGGGCTSGHGICGVARLSPRSLLATALFMATGIAVVYVVRHVLGG